MPPNRAKDGSPEPLLQQQKGTDHVVTHRHRLSLKRYPRDCPPVRPCWFHAVDIPKRRPRHADSAKSSDDKPEKPAANPKKYAAFSTGDSKAIEAAFQKMVEQEEANEETHGVQPMESQSRVNGDTSPNRKDSLTPGRVRVPVNEDYLFDVDVERRELGPAYWDGPVYDVRRGTWFYQDGSVQRPCDESLAAQLEEGYLKVRAWRLPTQSEARERARSESRPRERPASWTSETAKLKGATQLATQSSDRDLRSRAAETSAHQTDVPSQAENTEPTQTTYRLFGSHMNTVVTYQDGKTAWLLTDDFMSRMSSTVYQRFAGGSHFAGVKLTRGYVNPKQKEKDDKEEKTAAEKTPTSSRNTSPPALSVKTDLAESPEQSLPSPSETRRIKLERQMSSLLEDPRPQNADKQEQERQRRERKEIEDDYRESEGDDQGREIEHLILVTHGIGQRLGLRIESVNFVHDVNTLRKTLKAVYADSPDLRALNAELGNAETVNSRIQVLPVCWRNLLRFPQESVKHNRKEVDIADDSDLEDLNFPSLEDITVEGVPAVRNLITDLALDILLYQSPAYKDHISRIVLSECNRIYHLFKERNPAFKGKISMVGHSLGSAIMFDLLCRQEQQLHPTKAGRREQREMKLDFPVEDFYALGSPIGLFQMLKGRNIVARQQLDTRKTSLSTSMDDPMLDTPPHSRSGKTTHTQFTDNDVPVSSPRCSQIFNIFHPTDPISYRLEPLISPAMASLKPQPLPYTKRGIFGAPMGQGLSGIGTRVSQSVSSMWSSMASSLLTRGLGYSEDSTSKYGNPQSNAKTNAPLSMGAGTNVAAGVVPSTMPDKKLEQLANQTIVAGETGQHPPTLIDSEIETLYAGYQKRRTSAQADSELRDLGAGAVKGTPEWTEAEERAKRLRREEEKVRRLNSNGRVDYAIQEGVFDINLIAAIASHLSYWSDEDVSHFIISQLLSRHRVVRNGATQNKRFA